jgi:hypothetical protein
MRRQLASLPLFFVVGLFQLNTDPFLIGMACGGCLTRLGCGFFAGCCSGQTNPVGDEEAASDATGMAPPLPPSLPTTAPAMRY